MAHEHDLPVTKGSHAWSREKGYHEVEAPKQEEPAAESETIEEKKAEE